MIASITSLYTCSQKDKVSQANICCHFHESWEKKLTVNSLKISRESSGKSVDTKLPIFSIKLDKTEQLMC